MVLANPGPGNKILDTKVEYQHGGVKVIDNKLSVTYVFRVTKTMKHYNMSNNVMSNIKKSKKNSAHSKVIQTFDSNHFYKK